MTESEATQLLFVRDEPERADLAIVFGSREPSLCEVRARHGARLYRDGLVPTILLTGGETIRGKVSEAEYMSNILADAGIPRAAILLEVESRNTIENVKNALRVLRRRSLVSSGLKILLVSCPWHMRRVLVIAGAIFPPGTTLLTTPHTECCTATSWTTSIRCRAYVQNELSLLKTAFLDPPNGKTIETP